MNPLDWDANAFLVLYAALVLGALAVGVMLSRALRPAGNAVRLTDQAEIALLTGGRSRYAETVTTRMLANGTLSLTAVGSLETVGNAQPRGPAERAIASLGPSFRFARVKGALNESADAMERKLVDRGLVIGGGDAIGMRLVRIAPLMLLLVFGALRWRLGVLRQENVGILILMMFVAAIVALVLFFRFDRRTRSTKAEIVSLRARNDRLRRAPREHEMDTAVALYGPVVLIGTPFADLHRSSDGGGSGGTSDGGDGGGGCGGCGGCGG